MTCTRKNPVSKKTRDDGTPLSWKLELLRALTIIVALGGTVHAQGMYSVLLLYTI